MTFLTARWQNLILAQYAAPAELLTPRLPQGLELDLWQGQPVVSLVGFQFLDTRVLGIGWPGFRHFPELNLRTYVRRGSDRGVVFIREYVPSRFVSWVARATYNEPYHRAPMTMNVTTLDETIHVEYRIECAGRMHRMSAVGGRPAVRPAAGAIERFFKELNWGYGKSKRGTLLQYRVEHPEWDVHPLNSHTIDIDWAKLYGPEWGVMTGREPLNVFLAAGSAVAVYPKSLL